MLCSDDGDRLMTLAIGSGAANAAFVCGAAEVMARSFPPGAAPSWPGSQGGAPSPPYLDRMNPGLHADAKVEPSHHHKPRSLTRVASLGFACRAAVIGHSNSRIA